MPVVWFLPVEGGIGLDMIRPPKPEPRIIQYELTDFERAPLTCSRIFGPSIS